MTIRLGDEAPNFVADTTAGRINFHDWKSDSWAVLFSHPADFTPVCTTELGAAAGLKGEFEKRNTKVIGLSVDPLDSHQAWLPDVKDVTGNTVDFPVIADPDKTVAQMYDMMHPSASATFTVRSVFIIGPDHKVKLTFTYPAAIGRNFDELLRVLDALQLAEKHPVATPANWRVGDDVIVALGMSDEDAKKRFPDYVAKKPYLRVTEQPDK
jgi:alkyl hydroperoxide reductase subunit AhpC